MYNTVAILFSILDIQNLQNAPNNIQNAPSMQTFKNAFKKLNFKHRNAH